MFNFVAQKANLLTTIKACFIFWWRTLLSVLPLSLIVGLLNNWLVYIKPWLITLAPQTQTILLFILIVLSLLLSLIAYAAIFPMLERTAQQQPIRLSQGTAISLLRYPHSLLLSILLAVILGAPFAAGAIAFIHTHLLSLLILAIIFCIYLSVSLSCAFPLVINENVSALQAISLSMRLVKNHWWYTFGVLFVIYTFNIFIERIAPSGGSILTIVANAVCTPLKISAFIVLRHQLKLRQTAA